MSKTFREYAVGHLPTHGLSPEDWLERERMQEQGADDWKWFFDFDPLLHYFYGRWGQLALECGMLVSPDYHTTLKASAALQRLEMLDPTREVACFYQESALRIFPEVKFDHIIILPLVPSVQDFYGTLINGENLSMSNATKTEASRLFLHSWAHSENRSRAHRAREHMCNVFEQALAEQVAA